MTFDLSSSRLITCEADKTIKIYKEDDSAVSNFHSLIIWFWSCYNENCSKTHEVLVFFQLNKSSVD